MTVVLSAVAFFALALFMLMAHKLQLFKFATTASTTTTEDASNMAKVAKPKPTKNTTAQNQQKKKPRGPALAPLAPSEGEAHVQAQASPPHLDLPSPCGGGSYRISIADGDAEHENTSARYSAMATTPTTAKPRVISRIRFSGFPRSDVTESDRNTSQSEWSTLDIASTKAPCECVPVFTWRAAKLQPPPTDVDTVEIADLPGFSRKNLLEFKPQKPRILTTKRLKKSPLPCTPYFIV